MQFVLILWKFVLKFDLGLLAEDEESESVVRNLDAETEIDPDIRFGFD